MKFKILLLLFFSTLLPAMEKPLYLPKKVVILSVGLPGVGKTTLFQELSKQIANTVYLNKDLVNDALLRGEDYFSDYYNTYVRYQGYDVIFNLALANLKMGPKLVILDAQFGDKLKKPFMVNFLNNPNFEKKIIYFHCSENENRERLVKRGEKRNKYQLQNFKAYYSQTTALYLENLKSFNYLSINTENNLQENINEIINYLF